jgi:hypothetical protein
MCSDRTSDPIITSNIGWVMDDVTELTGMSNETIRVSFHKFDKASVAKYYQE